MNYMKILSSWNTTMINTIKTIKLFYVLLLSLSVILFSGCSGCDTDGGSGEDEPLSSEKAITSFIFEAANNTWSGTDYACTISGTDISVTLPYGTSLADLVRYNRNYRAHS
ncbi:MAG: hypothetical protein SVR08_00850 [Spirochaetota bacterium]|nr:hypothetical protein [Spirochaetota bacterium]